MTTLIKTHPGVNGLARISISNRWCDAELYLQGAHITHWQPRGQSPVLWMSPHAVFAPGKALRGGIPVCWPWFGPHPSDAAAKVHGFARTSDAWRVLGIDDEDEATTVRLQLSDDEATCALWPHAFDLTLRARFGRTLSVALTTENTGPTPLRISEALHTYLTVQSVHEVRISGLDSAGYIDQTRGHARLLQTGDVTFTEETDRIYLSDATCVLHDPGLGRRVIVTREGSGASVVWNPWPEKAQRLSDLGSHWPRFVCIETANAADAVVDITPGNRHSLSMTLHVETAG
jgi:glucose-6-phosphate 1-epimerase